MAILSKPIPPLYTVYILRSTLRHASLYIGSTPNPPRRLKQHNGDIIGGAARTSRNNLRPWEMIGIVSGFPGMTAALKFEWALTNPHKSLHIPSSSRITTSAGKKRNGQPKRRQHSLTSILSNLHLLLRVPSFAKWPLNVHFFAPEAYKAWKEWCATTEEPLRDTIRVLTDFDPSRSNSKRAGGSDVTNVPDQPWGIHALPLDYAPMKDYVSKTKSIYEFEREGNCVVCGECLEHGKGLYATCSNTDCEGTGHVSCWSRHMLGEKADNDIIPISGNCPRCKGQVMWGDLMKEMSLRVRGAKDIEKLLKKPRKRKAQAESST
ncbi:structure-specific endonuclease subunit SLX1 [Jackrogersella minutella]|nr:structure-specific endonuclease subunit SLX1 [Jackrogersella minutella]